MKRCNIILTLTILLATVSNAQNPNVILPEGSYPYWGTYNYIDIPDIKNINKQEWKETDHMIPGWDWSLPNFVKPAARSAVGIDRNAGWTQPFANFNLQFEATGLGLMWVDWADIEPTMGNYNFKGIEDRIKQANSVGVQIKLRILCHCKSRGQAPPWLANLGIKMLPQKDAGSNLNYDPADPKFHQHYLRLVQKLGETEIPKLVKHCYVGYASASHGDEGIGPHGETESELNDKEIHVRERIDAWATAFKGMETKMVMGASLNYGFLKGFGTRRGFVEMYYYRIPNIDMGQYVDTKGYLSVDETAPILKYKCYNGEVNEEYEAKWATAANDNRFGISTKPFPYRYFMSTLRALQMRCTYIHTTGHLVPQMLPFLALELGRTVEDAPDVWSFLSTSYLKVGAYKNNDWQNRPFTAAENTGGIECKNMERWLYQRDAVGYETQPDEKIQHAIKMTAIQDGKNYDYIAKSGKKIGFDIDNRWTGINNGIAVKISYLDKTTGSMNLVFNNGLKETIKTQALSGDGKLKTVTFFIPKLKANSMPNNFDFTLEAGTNTEKIVVSIVRVVATSTLTSISEKANVSSQNTIIVKFISTNKQISIESENEIKLAELCDLSGRVVSTATVNANLALIETNGYTNGLYVLKVIDHQGNFKSSKIVIR